MWYGVHGYPSPPGVGYRIVSARAERVDGGSSGED